MDPREMKPQHWRSQHLQHKCETTALPILKQQAAMLNVAKKADLHDEILNQIRLCSWFFCVHQWEVEQVRSEFGQRVRQTQGENPRWQLFK